MERRDPEVLLPDLFDLLSDALVDRYAVRQEVGRGGMATVFLAQDLKHHRQVAIKVLHPELASPMGHDRFLQEIEIAAGLQHPHILPLFDSGVVGDLLYYVMPYVEGESLRERLDREKQLSLEDTLKITSEVASALSHAHAHGVVHRDIKPENIMLTGDSAVVADFGIARAVSAAGDRRLTETGTVIGTPAYMSPEQATGSVEVDGRSDQYSLACVVYEMLVGVPPFSGPTAQAILARHSLDRVPPPSIVRDTIPEVLEDAVLRALAKTPADRFATAALFADALTAPSPATGAHRWSTHSVRAAKRPVLRWSIAGAAVLTMAVGLWLARARLSPSGSLATGLGAGQLDPRHLAVLYFQDLSQGHSLDYLADGLTEALIDRLAAVHGLQVISKDGVAAYRDTNLPRDSIARALGTGSLIEGSVENANARIRVTVRLVDGASGSDIAHKTFEEPAGQFLRVRDAVTEQVADFLRVRLGEAVRLREQQAGTANVDAWVLVQQAAKARKRADSLAGSSDMTGAAGAFARADSLLASAETADPHWLEPVLDRAANAYRQSRLAGTPEQAARFIALGMGHVGRALQRAPQDARALEIRGTLRYWRWLLHLEPDTRRAAELLRQAEDDLRGAVALDPSLAGAWSALSHLDYQKSDEVQAKIDAQRAYEADAYYSAADVILWRLFTSSYDLGQFVDADHWCDEGRRRFPKNPRFTQCELWRMTAPTAQYDVARAWALLDDLHTVTSEPQWPFERRKAQMAVAAVLVRAGQADSARNVLVRSRAGPDVDPSGDLLYNEAFVRTLLGDRDEALQLLKRFLAAHPERRTELAQDYDWWFRDLRSDPRYRTLTGTGR